MDREGEVIALITVHDRKGGGERILLVKKRKLSKKQAGILKMNVKAKFVTPDDGIQSYFIGWL